MLIKLAIMFIVLRLIFFTPHMQGLDAHERSDYVREQLTTPNKNP
ncbi:MAG: DUF4492 domain-containing protein [Rikenellaceae bacterium]|nr:DUF4492 domain-containing protein [Rikenellaceae bacterium]